ncbi:zinc-dependent metalloprotease [Propionibacteriaceae bacterium Y2011]
MTSPTVDWPLAATTARRLTKPGPEVTAEEATAAVASLRDAATRARDHVTDVTGLRVAGDEAPVLIVDRPTWVDATVGSFEELLRPLTEREVTTSRLTARLTGIEVGVLLAYLSRRILGQYDPYHEPAGRLLLIAPNIVQAERDLHVHPGDFRLWVALHEQTHVVQFTHAPGGQQPWLRTYLREWIAQLVAVTDLDSDTLALVARGVAGRGRRTNTGTNTGGGTDGGPGNTAEVSLLDLVQTPEQRQLVDRITGVMSLLEGHADVIMDEVGPGVIPSVSTIRKRFNGRRQRGGLEGVARRVLGMEAKMRQYREGASFCRAVLARVGMPGLNRVFTSPETLPTMAEILDPAIWLERVRPRR